MIAVSVEIEGGPESMAMAVQAHKCRSSIHRQKGDTHLVTTKTVPPPIESVVSAAKRFWFLVFGVMDGRGVIGRGYGTPTAMVPCTAYNIH
jgi:hypothetical protein